MDSLLELLSTYDCHLKRNNQSMKDFLHKNFEAYLTDLKNAINPKDNPLLGSPLCQRVSAIIPEIEENSSKLVETLNLYSSGKIVSASINAFDVFTKMKPYLMYQYSGAFHQETYYRIRSINSTSSLPLKRQDLFHIPYNKNYLVRTERYSMPGHPCLYLASQAELCWYECRKPENFVISKFDVPQSETCFLKFIDFSEKLMPLKTSFFIWFSNEKEESNKIALQNYFLKYIYTYPLRAACSVVAEHSGSSFIEEYIIPQLLLQWVLDDDDFDGIRYESCSSSDDVKRLNGHNLVLIAKDFDTDGYDRKLRKIIKLSEPTYFDINNIKINPQFKDFLMGKDIKEMPFLWELENISSDYEQI